METINGKNDAEGTLMGLYNRSILHLFSEHMPSYYVPYLKIQDDRMQLYFRNRTNGKASELSDKQLQALQNNKPSGKMSTVAIRKIRPILDTWLQGMLLANKQNYNVQGHEKRLPVFITLTLCAEQFHADSFVKRYMLGEFIKQIIRKHKVSHYFWRAESQVNGNIHFHLIIDRYIRKETISELWDTILGNHGYLSKFRSKTGKMNPSATNVKGIKDVKNFVAYVIKYAFKDEQNRLIEGRLWGMSDTLRKILPFDVQCTPARMSSFRAFWDDKTNKHYLDEYFAVVFIKNGRLIEKLGGVLGQEYEHHLIEEYNSLYIHKKTELRFGGEDVTEWVDTKTGEMFTTINKQYSIFDNLPF